MSRVVFVCTANVCRSPIAEAIFNALVSDAGLSHTAHSAGVAALVGEPMTRHARTALEEAGIYAGPHHATQVDGGLIGRADLVLTMTPSQETKLREMTPDADTEIHTLLAFVHGGPDREGISDPYGQSLAVYRASMRRIFECVDRLVDRLEG